MLHHARSACLACDFKNVCSLSSQEMLDKANKMLDFNLLDLCLKGPETELERLGGSKRWAKFFRGVWHGTTLWRHSLTFHHTRRKHKKSS